jgi:N-acetylmuramoyl-L-alanine amidase
MKTCRHITCAVVAVAVAATASAALAAPKEHGAKKAAIALLAKARNAAKIKTPVAPPSLASLQNMSAVGVCDRPNFRLLIDVGHTAEAAGAVSARGKDEYDFNLTLARELEDVLRGRGFERATVMITEGRTRPGLMSRVARINKIAPDLLLSIHHDSVPDHFLQKFDYDGTMRSYSDRFAGHSIFVSAQNAHYASSVLFARAMGNEMAARGLRYTPHYIEKFMGSRQRILIDAEAGVYRYDALLVLKNTHVPSVLLEAGSIINREEEWKLALPQYRAPITAAVADAVDLYCQFKPPASRAMASQPMPREIVNAAAPARSVHKGRKDQTRFAARVRKKPVHMAHATRK